MRELNDHKVNPANDTLTVSALDEPGSGGANHAYLISGFDNTTNPSDPDDQDADTTLILFQNGPIAEAGVNGVTHEALLAILCDRMRGFQARPGRTTAPTTPRRWPAWNRRRPLCSAAPRPEWRAAWKALTPFNAQMPAPQEQR